ncbi:MAG: sigma-70 family RNA polymerase sigma factor [Chitinophagales bacterium]|nr:sigma-70 family RNA polymerase sigma factor [Chitinophagales bacterium]
MRTQLLSDKELIDQYLAGNEHALERLINRYKDKVFTSILMFTKDKYLAEDIFQDTFIKVIDTLRSGKYKDEGKFAPWVMRISYNLCIDHFRKSKRTPTITNGDGVDIFNLLVFEEENPEESMMMDQARKKVRNLINDLPDEQKEVVILRHFFNFSFKEIAEMTDVSINTALGRMRYSLINLRKMIDQKQITF